jgi:hypothetical protein
MNEILNVWFHVNKYIFVTRNFPNLLQQELLDILLSLSEGMCWLHPENCFIYICICVYMYIKTDTRQQQITQYAYQYIVRPQNLEKCLNKLFIF